MIQWVKQCRIGHDDYDMRDHNRIVGFHPEANTFTLADGFSTHGLLQSPRYRPRRSWTAAFAPLT